MKGNRFLCTKLLLGMCFAIFFTVTLTLAAAESAPGIEWAKHFGGSDWDRAYSIQQTSDGGYVVVGESDAPIGRYGGGDYWVVKLDTSGGVEWDKNLGGTGHDYARSIQQTTDDGYIVAGYSLSTDGDVTGNHGQYDYWIVKLNTSGSIVWQKSLGGSDNDYAYSIQQTSDGGYIAAGSSNSNDWDVTGNHGQYDYWVVKLDISGNIIWQKCLGGGGSDRAYSVQQTSDGGYIVAGYIDSSEVTGYHGTIDYWVVKLDTDGNIVWEKCLGGSGTDHAFSIQQTSDSGYIVAGESASNDGDVTGNHGYYDYWVVKLDTSGSIVWQKSLGGSNDDLDCSIQQTFDGGYIVAGWSHSEETVGGITKTWVVKLDSDGNKVWQEPIIGRVREARHIQQTSDGGYILAGQIGPGEYPDDTYDWGGTDYWVVKLKASENIGNTPQGTNVRVILATHLVQFAEVTVAGDTTLSTSTTNPGSEIIGSFLKTYYEISTTAEYNSPVTICFSYDDSEIPVNIESSLRVFHWNGTDWEDVTSWVDTENNFACAIVDSLSWFALAYDNTAPEVTAAGDTIYENGIATVIGTISDPDIDDTFEVTINWGDENTETFSYPSGSTEFSETHQYMDDDPSGTSSDDYTVTVTVTDDDMGEGTASTIVTVNNVAPDVEAGSDLEVTAGDLVSFSGTFSDPSWLDTHTAEWNFGEGTLEAGSVSEENEYPDSTGTVSGSFSYFDAGDYTVTLNVTDDDGGIGQDQLTVTVLPIVAAVDINPGTLNLGSGGEWVTAYIELPEGYDVAGINASSVLLNGEVSAVKDPKYEFVTNENEYLQDFDGDLIIERMVKFDREEVESILETGEEVTVTLAGKVEYDNGISSDMASFEGSDVITVNEKKKDKTKK